MSVAYAISAAVVAALLGWAINQLPPLKDNFPAWLRLGVVVVLVVISVVIADRLNGDQQVTNQTGPKTTPTSTSNPDQSLGPAPIPSTSPTSVRRSTGADLLTLSEGYFADFDSEQPDWDVSDSRYGKEDLQFSAGGVGDILVGLHSEMALMSQEPTYESCRATTSYGARIGLGEARAGLMLCVKTSEKRLASVVIVKRSSQNVPNEQVQLRVTVWDPPLE
ncbi:hypothetical protein [Micromonospora sp. B006]|uniref:hypothetical protein n=1 Tax=Micromonospora sp. B006 TaxID=2201999 RepID=UPI001260259C|nr:hypothetical protein [Micromonospora sp. B006]